MLSASCRDLAWRQLGIPQLPHLKNKRHRFFARSNANDDDAINRPLSTLDSYFEKLQGPSQAQKSPPQENARHQTQQAEQVDQVEEYALKEELLLRVLREVEAAEKNNAFVPGQGAPPNVPSKNAAPNVRNNAEEIPEMTIKDSITGLPRGFPQGEPTPIIIVQPGSLLVCLLVGINVGVYVFGLATSQGENGVDLTFLSGAKENDLILSGEWWRLVTPVFLHAGVLHICLSSWALLSFGPQVEALYGSMGFLIIYFLGGGIGNLASFLETPSSSTVGGTGPVFAIIFSWFSLMLKNRGILKAYDTLELVQKSVVFASLSLGLGNQLPIDSWTHLGGAFVGLLFGLVASPLYQTMQDDEMAEGASKPDDETSKVEGEKMENLYLVLLLCCGALAWLLYIASQDNFGTDMLNDFVE